MTGSYNAPISWCIYHKKLITIEINNIIKLTVYKPLKLPELQITKIEHNIMITISILMCAGLQFAIYRTNKGISSGKILG